MGKRLSISQPTVIQTELRPLSESFWIDANGQLEQWYYQNTGVFSPDRQITALRLSPKLSLLDLDTNASYSSEASQEATEPPLHVSIQNVVWTVKEWNGSTWVETNISSVTAGDPYHTDGNDLIVSKNNYDAAHAINIKCRCNYADPRDIGTTCWLETTLMLVTNMDATQVYPTIDIKNPSARMFNPLKDDPIYEFEAEANWDVLEGQGGTDITEYKVDALGTEKILPANEDMLVNAAPLLDIKYGDRYIVDGQGNHIPQQFMERQVSGGVVSDIPDGLAKIDNIKGDTAKIVQLCSNGDFSNGVTGWYSRQSGGLTASNGVASFIKKVNSGTNSFSKQINFVAGHKYYVGMMLKSYASTIPFYLKLSTVTNIEGGSNIVNIVDVNASKVGKYISAVYTPQYNYTYIGIMGTQFQDLNVGDIVATFTDFIVLDLTAMGIDNLTTTAEVESWLASHIGKLDYIPYTGGKLINYGGYSVKWNQMVNGLNSSTYSLCTYADNKFVFNFNTTTQRWNDYLVGKAFITLGHKYYIKSVIKSGTISSGSITISDGIGTNVRVGVSGIGTANSTKTTAGFGFMIAANTVATNVVTNINIVDLTLMFGAGNEPDLAWCDKYLSRDYYDYCAGIDKNILDVAEVKTAGFNKWDGSHIDRKVLNATSGEEVADGSCFYTDYISVLPNTDYYFNKTFAVGSGAYGVCYYDKSKNFISGSVVSESNTGYTRKTPSNAYYMRGCGLLSTLSAGCINISDPSKNGTYEPYKAQYEKLPMGVKSVGFNQFDTNTLVVGKYRDTDGTVSTNENRRCSNVYFPCLPNTTYYAYSTNQSTSNYRVVVCWYDANKAYISGTDIANPRITSPSNAAYFRVSSVNKNGDICINLSDTNRKDDQDVWGQQWVAGAYSASNGNFDDTVTTSLSSKGKIEVLPNRIYLLWLTSSKGGNRIVCFYDSSNNFISAQTLSAANSVTFTTPATAAYMTFTIVNYGSEGYDYDNDIVLNLSKNGTYEAHWQSFSDMSWITKIGIENFNIWDEEWLNATINDNGGINTSSGNICTKNYISVSPDKTYCLSVLGTYSNKTIKIAFYQADKTYIHSSYLNNTNGWTFTPPSNCRFIKFTNQVQGSITTYNHDICLNESIPAYNGKYLPHGQTMPYFPNGLCHAGSVYDEVKVENGKIKGVVRFNMVALNTWKWIAEGTSTSGVYRWSSANHADVKRPSSTTKAFIGICTKYATVGSVSTYIKTEGISMEPDADIVRIYDSTYNTESDIGAFVSSLTGVYLVYELTTPIEFEIDYPTKGQFEWYGIDGSGNEVPIDTLPVYSQAEQPSGYGQHSSRIRINALYAQKIPIKKVVNNSLTTVLSDETIPVILRVKRYPWSTQTMPMKVMKSVSWKIPPLRVSVLSNRGSAVMSADLVNAVNFTFGTIVNQGGEVISDEKKQEHLVFDWYYAKMPAIITAGTPSAVTPTPLGSGLTMTVSSDLLKNLIPSDIGAVRASTSVYCEVFILGPYHIVNGVYVRTKDNT